MDAIDTAVSAILKPVIEYIERITGFTMPEFPTAVLDDLPLDFFDDYSFKVPDLPDMSQLFSLPQTVLDSLPAEMVPSALLNCGIDVDCLSGAMGVSDMIDGTVGAVGGRCCLPC